MKTVTIYTSLACPHCIRAKALLKREGVHFTEIDISDGDNGNFQEMQEKCPGSRTVPQILVGDQPIGGCDDLEKLLKNGEFAIMLAS